MLPLRTVLRLRPGSAHRTFFCISALRVASSEAGGGLMISAGVKPVRSCAHGGRLSEPHPVRSGGVPGGEQSSIARPAEKRTQRGAPPSSVRRSGSALQQLQDKPPRARSTMLSAAVRPGHVRRDCRPICAWAPRPPRIDDACVFFACALP